jgi:hypothetical protein
MLGMRLGTLLVATLLLAACQSGANGKYAAQGIGPSTSAPFVLGAGRYIARFYGDTEQCGVGLELDRPDADPIALTNGRMVTLQPALAGLTLDRDTTFTLVATGPACAWWVRIDRSS